jgi:hypothetical protein
MSGRAYTENEIILCTFIARFGIGLITEEMISDLENRSVASIKMKIQNIIYMLDEAGVPRDINGSPLSGMPPGKGGRWTNWDIVENLCTLSKKSFLKMCFKIIKAKENNPK